MLELFDRIFQCFTSFKYQTGGPYRSLEAVAIVKDFAAKMVFVTIEDEGFV